jgi:uncharacterized phage protein gp47/JayE
MAILPAKQNLPTTFRQFRDKINKRTKINHWGADSTVRAFIDTTAAELIRQRLESRRAFKAIQTSSATGQHLDRIADNWGISRLPRSFAQVDYHETSLTFYTESTFGLINGGGDIVIPQGTVIRGPAVAGSQSPVQFETTGSYTLPAGASIAYCAAKAIRSGPRQNVASGALRRHDFTGYTDTANNTLKVTNLHPILNGRSKETDEDLRYRISNRYTSLSQLNRTKIRLGALEVPGVLDIAILSSYYGIGTCAVVVFGARGASNTQLTSRVQAKLQRVQAPGLKLIALTPVNVYFDFNITISIADSISSTEQHKTEQAIHRIVQKYFLDRSRSNVNIRDVRNLVYRAASAHVAQIKSSSRNPASFFDAVYIRRAYAHELTTSEREQLIKTTYNVEPDEVAAAGLVDISFRVGS